MIESTPIDNAAQRSALQLTPTGSSFTIAGLSAITGRTWGTLSESKISVLLVHGLAAHSGWFETLARRFKIHQMYTIAYDQLGFGLRQNQKFTNCDQWIYDLKTVYQHLKQQSGNKPIYLMGNSMGAIVSLAAVEELNPAGLVLFAPGFAGHPDTFTLAYRIKAILTALLKPDSELDLPYTANQISRDQSAQAWVTSDPLKRFKIPARMLLECLKLTGKVQAKLASIATPTLLVTAGADSIVNNKVTNNAFNQITSSNKQLCHFQDAYHDLMFDPIIDELTEKLLLWMSSQQH